MDSSSKVCLSNSSSKAMGEAINSRRYKEMENISLEMSKYPRDLLQRFLGNNNHSSRTRLNDLNLESGLDEYDDDYDDDNDGLNLGLGLSLGGMFGVDKSHKGLVRSSSIIGTMPLIKEEVTVALPVAVVQPLARTASLPVESEEEWRKRKEMQTLRRMEAKRRRSEKQRVWKENGEEKGVESVNFRGRLEKEQHGLGIMSSKCVAVGSSSTPPLGVVKRRTTFGSLQGFLAQAQAQAVAVQQGCYQGSKESQGGSSSSASELESKTHQGSSSCGEARSSSSFHSLQERGSHESGTKGETTQGPSPELETSLKQPETNTTTDNRRRESAVAGGMEDMPCVFTIGDGPSGRKVEGILYRYGKGEGVHIMCVCHGSFFSPAEFVKHAGGRDVEHPLRHIVVSPTASPFQ